LLHRLALLLQPVFLELLRVHRLVRTLLLVRPALPAVTVSTAAATAAATLALLAFARRLALVRLPVALR
jgi:hypothetical protein